MCWVINYWYIPIQDSVAMSKKGMQVAIENGDLQYFFVFSTFYFSLFNVGVPLREVLNASKMVNLEDSKIRSP